MDHLRSKRRMRHASEHGQSRGQIVDALSIRERPAEAEDRAIPGHWEGDLLAGAKNSYIATLVERHSRFAMLIKVPSKDTAVVVAALSKPVRKLPATLRRSLTWDRGLEMAKHKEFTVATDVQVYFCDPQSPWQRGTNENTNLLLRQYFPRGTDLSSISQAQLDQVSLRLNQRPRKTLGFQTPASRLQASVASTSRPTSLAGLELVKRLSDILGPLYRRRQTHSALKALIPGRYHESVRRWFRPATGVHWCRVVMDQEIEKFIRSLDCSHIDALEISGTRSREQYKF